MAPAELAATRLELLLEAALHYGPVRELLSVIHEMRRGQHLELDAADLLEAASIAALLARAERLSQGIDAE